MEETINTVNQSPDAFSETRKHIFKRVNRILDSPLPCSEQFGHVFVPFVDLICIC